MSDELNDDYDSPWKEALDLFFEQFLQFFFPAVHAGIDWSHGAEFLDTEFQQFVPESENGRRTVDKLAKVWLKSGELQCLFLHAELQGSPERNFSERLYVYNYRIFDAYRVPVVSLALLMDDSDGEWCKQEFGYSHFGCEVKFTFPVAKLNALRSRIDELERSDNPISVVILAHLKTQDTRREYDKRLLSKVELVRILLRKGFSLDVVRTLLRLLDWLLYLPEQYKKLYLRQITQIQEETAMPFVDCIEEQGIEKGIELGRFAALHDVILENLTDRFGSVPPRISDAISAVRGETELRRLRKASVLAQSLAEFETLLVKP